ncbi:hypothetical protein Syun_022785 [Stephania yunnanensis]|uniref:Bromo domain-containing protein n=1 Tax=Stephania yunnanensis TaxID=152371 RepID=A0AAP0F8C3_9MAGN
MHMLQMELQKCGALLRKLMNHQIGFLFNQPVKPVALQIPDYFDIISEPIDLGTVKKKLENGLYSSVRDFAADVRLTFSNAMKYNPSTNWVHELAMNLLVSIRNKSGLRYSENWVVLPLCLFPDMLVLLLLKESLMFLRYIFQSSDLRLPETSTLGTQ